MENELLPIGTVCTLNGGEKKMMITAFLMSEEGESKIYDYCGCFYPEGIMDTSENYLFNHDQIKTVHYMGYSDEDEKNFKQELNKYRNNKSSDVQDIPVEMPSLIDGDLEVLDFDDNNASDVFSV